MTPAILKKIADYTKAERLASENATLLCGAKDYSDECGRRMERLDKAEEKMLNIPEKDMPPALLEYSKATDDQPECPCRYSSRMDKIHPECKKKMDRWFAARKALVAYGLSLLPTKPENDTRA